MKRIEIQANGLEEAKLKAYEMGVTVVYDATRYWQSKGSPMFDKELLPCIADLMLERGLFDFKDAGVIITIHKGSKSTRKCPYKVTKFKGVNRDNAHRVIEVCRSDNGIVLGEAKTKDEAVELAKQFVTDLKIDVYGRMVYKSISNSPILTVTYTPSKKMKGGQYLVFATDDADVKLSKQKSRGFL